MSKLVLNKPIRLIEMFGGIGSQYSALKNIGANVTSWAYIDFDKYAVKSYNAIHGANYEPMDITEVHASDLNIEDTDKYDYVCCYSFPCQDLSLAGSQNGMEKGSGTRSSLLWEVERILKECVEYNKNLPRVLLMENVTQVHSKKNENSWASWLAFLESLGYKNYWQDLNAKEYGYPQPVAQNRNRCFMVSVLGNETYEFPEKKELTTCIRDYLEPEEKIDPKRYVTTEKAFALIRELEESGALDDYE